MKPLESLILITFLLWFSPGISQTDENSNPVLKDTLIYSPYRIKPKIDIPLTVIGYGTNYFGLKALRSKKSADTENILTLTPEDVPIKLDRSAARQNPAHAPAANLASDISLVGCFIFPGFMILDKRIKHDAFKVLLMHLETQAIMANMYFLTMTVTHRKRPYVYNVNEDPERRTRVGNNNSFYGGHASHAASCSFFVAKVLSDYYPDRKWKPFLYSAALIPPGIVGYLRYRAGQHFPTDLVAGTIIGGAVGILIPELHKPRKDKNKKKLSINPFMGPAQGLSVTYSIY